MRTNALFYKKKIRLQKVIPFRVAEGQGQQELSLSTGKRLRKENLTTLELHCANSEARVKRRVILVVLMKQ